LTSLCRCWSAALEASDLDGIASFFADDGVLVLAGVPLVRGASAIRDLFAAGRAAGGPAPTFEPGQVWESGDLVVDVGTYRVAGDAGGHGKYVVVWERQPDGSLKAIVDAPVAD
jgi:ketosteroid isomerase-like protein